MTWMTIVALSAHISCAATSVHAFLVNGFAIRLMTVKTCQTRAVLSDVQVK
jgi:hypothetical protein